MKILVFVFFIFSSLLTLSQVEEYPTPQDEYFVKKDIKPLFKIVKKNNMYGFFNKTNKDTLIPTIYDSIYYLDKSYLIIRSQNINKIFSILENKIIFNSTEKNFEVVNFLSYSNKKIKKYFVFSKNNKLGLIDTTGQILVKPIFDSFDKKSFHNGNKNLILISYKNKKKGFIFLTDTLVEITPNYEEIISVNFFFAGQNFDKTFDLFDSKGNLYYEKACKLYHSGYIFSKRDKISIFAGENQKFGVFSIEAKKLLIPFKYDEIQEINDTLLKVKLDNKMGIINYSNEIIIPIDYDLIYELYDGILKGKKDNLFLFVNFKNETLVGDLKKFDDLKDPNLPIRANSKIKVYNQNYLVGLIDKKTMKLIVPCEYEDILEENKMSFIFRKGQKLGLVNDLQTISVPAEYDKLTFLFSHREETAHLLIAEKNGKKGLINDKNEIILDFIYDLIEFNNLHLKLKLNNKYKLASIDGKLFKNSYDHIGFYNNGNCLVIENKNASTIDENCKPISNLINDVFGISEIDSFATEFEKTLIDSSSFFFNDFCRKISLDAHTETIAKKYNINLDDFLGNLDNYIFILDHTKEQITKIKSQLKGRKIIQVHKVSEAKEYRHVNNEYFLLKQVIKLIVTTDNGNYEAYFELINYDGFYKIHKVHFLKKEF